MDEDEDDARCRPNHSSASGSSAIAGSGLNIAVRVFEKIIAEPRGDGDDREDEGQRDPGAVADQQHAQRHPAALHQFPAGEPVPQCRERRAEGREQQRILSRRASASHTTASTANMQELPRHRRIGEPLPQGERISTTGASVEAKVSWMKSWRGMGMLKSCLQRLYPIVVIARLDRAIQ